MTYIIVDRAGSTRTCIHTPGPAFTPEEMPRNAIESMLEGAALLYFDGRLTEVALKVAAVAQDMGVPMLVVGLAATLCILHHAPRTLHHAPCTKHHAPLHPAPCPKP
jgi:hypothetical protein